METSTLPPSTEIGRLNVKHLKRYWQKCLWKRNGIVNQDAFHDEWRADTTLLTVLGLGLEQTINFVYQSAPTFDELENWIMLTSGTPDPEKVKRFNMLFDDDNTNGNKPSAPTLLTASDFEFWDKNGYLIIKDAVPREDCEETIEVLCDFIHIDRYQPDSWYTIHPARQGIMVQLFQHAVLERNRHAPKIKKAFEELWGRTDIWANTDRVGFNPPETDLYKFQGPHLHWDASIQPPMPFGTQGILYLADTAKNQGALTLVPGFQNKIEAWLASLPPNTNPRLQDLYALGAEPIAAEGGDLIIWNQALPHGSSPNTNASPRFVQYINYVPFNEVETADWL